MPSPGGIRVTKENLETRSHASGSISTLEATSHHGGSRISIPSNLDPRAALLRNAEFSPSAGTPAGNQASLLHQRSQLSRLPLVHGKLMCQPGVPFVRCARGPSFNLRPRRTGGRLLLRRFPSSAAIVRDDEEGNGLDNTVGSGYEGLLVVLCCGAMPTTTDAPFIAYAPPDIIPPPVVSIMAIL